MQRMSYASKTTRCQLLGIFCSYGLAPWPSIQLPNERKEGRCCRNII
jgi:hypothetical protein